MGCDIVKEYFLFLRIGLAIETSVVRKPSLTEIQWRDLYELSVRQGTGAFVWDALQLLDAEKMLPVGLRLQWAYHVEQIERRFRIQEKVLGEIAAFLAAHSIPLMLLKGYGLSLYYPHPEHRPFSDIDIWLYGKQRVADDLLRQERNISISEEQHHHTVFFYKGIMVENHYDFLNIHSHASNSEIERLLKKCANAPGLKFQLANSEIHLPSARFNALFLLRHTAAHFAADKICVRHLTDWVVFIRHYHDQIDWPELYSTARQMNMHLFLNCMNAISIDCLGLDATLLPSFERNTQLEKRVLNDILHSEFNEEFPNKGFIQILLFKLRRWHANRWKHRIVYSDNLIFTFCRQIYSHFLKPKSLISK